jgi:hypothetical protein
MPIVEFMLHPVTEGAFAGGAIWSKVPSFIAAGESHWESPIDKTRLGYVYPEDKRNYYIPDTLTYLDKEGCIQRALTIHATKPYIKIVKKPDATEAEIKKGLDEMEVELNENEIRELIGNWYDDIMKRYDEV